MNMNYISADPVRWYSVHHCYYISAKYRTVWSLNSRPIVIPLDLARAHDFALLRKNDKNYIIESFINSAIT